MCLNPSTASRHLFTAQEKRAYHTLGLTWRTDEKQGRQCLSYACMRKEELFVSWTCFVRLILSHLFYFICFVATTTCRAALPRRASRPRPAGWLPAVDPECREFETDQTIPEDAQDGQVITARYQLPSDLSCDRCILQMVYCELSDCIFVYFLYCSIASLKKLV